MEWFLQHVLTPLLLPIFVIVVLGLLCDVKPDPFIKLYLDIMQTIFTAIFKALAQGLKLLANFLCRVFRCVFECACGVCEKPPKRSSDPPKRTTPTEAQTLNDEPYGHTKINIKRRRHQR
jgi:hypothetical protein